MGIGYQSRNSRYRLSVTTQPSKTQYFVGDTLDLSGIVVSIVRRNGTTQNVTSQCTFSPSNGTSLNTEGETTVTITYQGMTTTTTVNTYVIESISITTPPTKTSYYMYDYIDTSGIVVKAFANSGAISKTVTSSCTFSPANGSQITTSGNKTLTATYNSKTASTTLTVTNTIYGAEWAGGSSSAWTRTDLAASFSNPSPAVNNGSGSSPFDNIQPWSGMTRTSDSGGGTLVKIPKYYYKWTRSGSKMKLQISSVKLNGFLVSPAHASGRGTSSERSTVYVGAYNCSSSNYKSVSGATPKVNMTKATARTSIHNLGSTYWQYDFAMYWTIAMLYLVEYADWNSQAKIGVGCGSGSLEVTGKTDAMTYHTGTNASNRSTAGHVRYRYVEDLWANCWDIVDGIYFIDNKVYTIKNPSDFSDSSNGTLHSSRPTTSGLIKSWIDPSIEAGFEYALIPSTVSGSDYSTYVCDDYAVGGTSGTYLVALGATGASTEQKYGLFKITTAASTYTGTMASCRLMKLP